MSNIIDLTDHERSEVCRLAEQLAKRHAHKFKTAEEREVSLKKTRIGLICEAAVIKILNDVLRSKERIFLNEEYSESGGDGGWDFQFFDIKIDVKFANKDQGVPIHRIRASTADLIALVSCMPKLRGVVAHGFVPRERFIKEGHDTLLPKHCMPLATLKRLFPDYFLDLDPKRFKRIPVNCYASSFMHEGTLNLRINGEPCVSEKRKPMNFRYW